MFNEIFLACLLALWFTGSLAMLGAYLASPTRRKDLQWWLIVCGMISSWLGIGFMIGDTNDKHYPEQQDQSGL